MLKVLVPAHITRYGTCTKQIVGKRISFCRSFKALSTDTSFINPWTAGCCIFAMRGGGIH